MAKIGLQGACVVPLIGQSVAARVPEHVRVSLKAQLGLYPRPLDPARKSSGAKGGATLRREHEGRLRLLLALKPP